MLTINETICLDRIQPTDSDACVKALNERDIYDMTLRIPYPYESPHFQKLLDAAKELRVKHDDDLLFAIRKDEEMIGAFGFDGLVPGHTVEIGYWLAKPWWGRGIMTEVVGKAVEYAAERWDLVRITALVFERNERSARVLEKNGFVREGLLRKATRKNDVFMNDWLYAWIR